MAFAGLLALSGDCAPARGEDGERPAESGFYAAVDGGVAEVKGLVLRRLADLRHDAERSERTRLRDEGARGALQVVERGGDSRRGLRGLRVRGRDAPPQASERARLPDVLEGFLALFPAGGLLRWSGAADRSARQDPRQLQRERPGPDCGARDAGRSPL